MGAKEWKLACWIGIALVIGEGSVSDSRGELLSISDGEAKPLPEVSFIAEEGNETSLHQLVGQRRMTILAPVYTACPSVCPDLARRLRDSYELLPPDRQASITVVFLSFQSSDEPPQLSAFS